MNLLKGLVRHLSPDKAVDDMLRDFFGGRLPPYGKGVKKGDFTTYCNVREVTTLKGTRSDLAAFPVATLYFGMVETFGGGEGEGNNKYHMKADPS